MAQYEKSLGAPQIDKDEHILVNGVNAKRVLCSGYDGTNLQDIKVDTDGNIQAEIVSATIEQTTGAVHNDLNIAIAGKDTAGKVQSISTDTDGTVRVNGAGNGCILDGVDTAIKATVKDLTNSNPVATFLVDANGDQITSFGGGTQYTEDDAAAANPVGTALNLIRDDALSGQTTTDGDNVAARGTDKGELYVKHVDAIPVTDNGGALTVDASNLDIRDLTNADVVTAELSATDNAVLDTIAAKDFATQTTLAAVNAKLVTGTVIGDVNLGATDNAVLDTIAAKDFATQTTLAALNAKLVTGTVIGDVNLGATDNAVLDALVSAMSPLVWLEETSYDIDNSSTLVYDCSAELNTCRYVSVTNAGTADVFLRVGTSGVVGDGSTANYGFRLAQGETRWFPCGYNSGTANDIYAIRLAAQTNDNVLVNQWGYAY
jgi:hypothetical protein